MNQSPPQAWSKPGIVLAGILLAAGYLLLLAFALNIPFAYPSSSSLYKFGWDKTMLRGGKMVGITVLLLLALQPVFVARFALLGRVFGVNLHALLHRLNGFFLSSLILFHPLLVRAAENFAPIPLAGKYWPEFLGLTLLGLLGFLAGWVVWRKRMKIAYRLWRKVHTISGFTLLFGVLIHAHFVSTSFQTGPPRLMLLVVGAGLVFLLLRLRNKILA